jgi:hypothetical protein
MRGAPGKSRLTSSLASMLNGSLVTAGFVAKKNARNNGRRARLISFR